MNSPSRYEQRYAETAVQLRFLTRGQLDSLVEETSSGMGENLAQRLVRRQLISEAEAEAIGAVTEQQLARETNRNADIANATVGADPAVTAAPVQSSQRDAPEGDSFATLGIPAGQSLNEFGRFAVLRPHAKGGLGQVLIARDVQLNREIALKEILPSHADDAVSRQRFLREAEITGALEHPGIVPVYSLGQYADGRPFYAMRFVLGQNLSDAIEQLHANPFQRASAEFELRQLLGRFVDVCQAIEYAHNRGIVHRDIKPENIMLGDFGETLVVDWGLARPVDAQDDAQAEPGSEHRRIDLSPRISSSHTQAGHVVGTPIYMSPEQAEGRLDLLGPASDIYSLGATLYHMLAGAPPFASDSGDVLARVQRGQFKSPRQVNSQVARPLEAICLRAMAVRPPERYQTARELGLEIDRYLADEKVTSYEEPLWMRTWRWVRHHRTAVMSLAAAVTVALAALSAGVILLGAANRRERSARQEATNNLIESVKQRDRAEQNFALAQEAVRNYYIQISEETLLSQPGMQPLRNALLQQAMVYYDQFLQQRSDDPKLRSELAQAAFYVGRITEIVSSPELALPYYQQSIDLYDQLREASSTARTNPIEADYARVLNAMGGANQKLRNLSEAREFYRRATELREKLAAAAPDDHESARELSNTLMNLGTLALHEGNAEEAIRQMTQAQSIRLAHATDSASLLKLQRDIAIGYFNLAAAQLASAQMTGVEPTTSELADTERNLLNAADAFARLGEQTPLAVDHQRRLAIAHRLLGDLAGEQDRRTEAIAYYQLAGAALRKLVDDNPSVPAYAVDLAGVLMNLGVLHSQRDDYAAALTELDGATNLLTELAADPESPPRYRRDLAAARRAAGQVLVELNRPDDSLSELQASRDILQALVRQFPTDQDFATQLQQTLTALQNATDEK